MVSEYLYEVSCFTAWNETKFAEHSEVVSCTKDIAQIIEDVSFKDSGIERVEVIISRKCPVVSIAESRKTDDQ